MKTISKTLSNIRRTPYQALSAILVLTLTFFVAILVAFSSIGLRQSLEFLESQPQILVFFETDAEEEGILQAQADLEANPAVDSVTYVSQEEALLKYRELNQSEPQLLELVTADILPASLEISGVSIESLSEINQQLQSIQGIDEIIVPEDVVEKLESILQGVRYAGSAFVIVSALTSFLIVAIVIGMKIANKSFEIRVLKLMGASDWFVQSPYLLEGVVYGFLASNFAYALVVSVLFYSSPYIFSFAGNVPLFPLSLETGLLVYAISVGSAMVLGLFASSLAVRRYLSV